MFLWVSYKKNMGKKLIFFGNLKVSEERSRIRSWIWIRRRNQIH
jgi:hypothetical protein